MLCFHRPIVTPSIKPPMLRWTSSYNYLFPNLALIMLWGLLERPLEGICDLCTLSRAIVETYLLLGKVGCLLGREIAFFRSFGWAVLMSTAFMEMVFKSIDVVDSTGSVLHNDLFRLRSLLSEMRWETSILLSSIFSLFLACSIENYDLLIMLRRNLGFGLGPERYLP